jgi:hypothetical protein
MAHLFYSLGIPYHYLTFAFATALILESPHILWFIVSWYILRHQGLYYTGWVLTWLSARVIEVTLWIRWLVSSFLLLCFLPAEAPLVLNAIFFPIYVTLIGPIEAFIWWFIFLKKIYGWNHTDTKKKIKTPARRISRKVSRKFILRNKTHLQCFAAKLLILSAYRVHGSWAGLLGSKHVDDDDTDVSVSMHGELGIFSYLAHTFLPRGKKRYLYFPYGKKRYLYFPCGKKLSSAEEKDKYFFRAEKFSK